MTKEDFVENIDAGGRRYVVKFLEVTSETYIKMTMIDV